MEKTLYMIGNAHIDPVWLWRWQDGYSEIRATFRSALDRMEETPGFIFTSACAAYYEWIERNDPDMFAQIQWRVAEGRWAIVGGWWIQPDCNLASGESLARQALYSQRYFREKFGIMARTGYAVDSFGHSGSIPKILRMSGMDRYVFMRPGSHEMALPAPLFVWQSPEGVPVTAFRLPFTYCTWGDELSAHVARCAAEIRDARGLMCFYGVGNHGGGPTRQNLDSIAKLDGEDGLRLILSSPDRYFKQAIAAGEPMPTVTGDLLHHASGCYCAHSGVKQWNRRAENRLATAEKWAVLARLAAEIPYPQEALTAAWKKVLFNQFHDILAGTSLIEAYEDARQDYGFALSTADAVINEAQQAMMRRIGIPFEEGARPFVAFNPHAFATKWPISLECAQVPDTYELVDDTGEPVPYQMLTSSTAAPGRQRISFVADLPAMGYRVYRLLPRGCGYFHFRPVPVQGNFTLENEWIRADFSPETGALSELLHKPTGTQMLREETAALILRDESDTWSHGVLRFDEEIGRMKVSGIERIAEGEACATVRVTRTWGKSLLIEDFTLYRELPYLMVQAQVNWQEKQKALKLRFALGQNSCQVTAQGPFGYADRPANGEEFPMQQWVDVSGVAAGESQGMTGLAILNDGKYSYDVHDGAIHMTVLRSPYYAHHNPFIVEAGMSFPVTDQGWQTFTYVLMPHGGAACDAGVDGAAAVLNAPPELLPESFHQGTWPQAQPFVQVRGDTVQLDALKLAEDGSGDIIAHLHETARREADAMLDIRPLNRRIALHFTPGQLRAVRIPLDASLPVEEVNYVELPVEER